MMEAMARGGKARPARFAMAVALAIALSACGWLASARPADRGASSEGAGAATPAPLASEPVAALSAASSPEAGAGPSEGSSEPIPVLMYHELGDPAGAWSQLYVDPDDFRRQMEYLKTHGYHTLTLAEAVDVWSGRRSAPEKPVVITFDDGYESAYAVALPVLRANGQVATLFLQAGLLNRPHALTDAMVESWLAAGNELGSHTMTHPDLRQVSNKRLTEEVAGSRTFLAQRFKVVVRTFAYPSGRYDARVIAAVKEAGYVAAVTTNPGLARPDERYTLRRIRINRSDGLDGFIKKLTDTR